MKTIIKKYFPNIFELYAYQERALQSILNKKNTMAIVPTGGGKSLIYQLSAVVLPGLTIVVSPLKALMQEQVEELNNKKIKAIAINSDMPFQEQRRILRELGSTKPQIVYVSPERLHNYFFKAALLNSGLPISLIAIDEAHCISQWGIDFRPDYANIKPFVNFLHESGHEPVLLALTATISRLPREDIVNEFEIEEKLIERTVIRDNLELNFKQVKDDEEKLGEIIKFIMDNHLNKVLVYTYSRPKCEQLSTEVEQSGFFHAGLSSSDKVNTYYKFKNGDIKVMFSTTAFGMGMNIPDIDGVIHYQIPESVEEYYQHVGRGAREKNLCPICKCLFLWTEKNFEFKASQIKAKTLNEDELRKGFERLNPRKRAGSLVQINYQELYYNDGSFGTVNLKLALQFFEKHKAIDILGEVNGTPHTIKFFNNTKLWDEVLKKLGSRNSFLLASKRTEKNLLDIVKHIYEEELKGNIEKIPAEEKQLFLRPNYSELPQNIISQIINTSKAITEYKLELLSQLEALTIAIDKEKYISEILDIARD